jgi:hypothetical protein
MSQLSLVHQLRMVRSNPRTWPLFLGILGASCAAAVVIAYYLPSTQSTQADAKIVRWGNVSVAVSDDAGVDAVPDFAPSGVKPPDGGQALLLVKDESRLLIDADTGSVLHRSVSETHQQAFEAILTTVRIHSGDSREGWPYSGLPSNNDRLRWGSVTFLTPDPRSGLAVFTGIDDLPTGAINTLTVTNGHSNLLMNADTGEIIDENTNILQPDVDAFDAFLRTIEQPPP